MDSQDVAQHFVARELHGTGFPRQGALREKQPGTGQRDLLH
ncbi:hypothetical protein [Kineococcus sp. GCM10028916]